MVKSRIKTEYNQFLRYTVEYIRSKFFLFLRFRKSFSSHLVDTATVANHSKLWLYVVCFNSQVMKRISYFDDLNLSGDFKISLNFTICLLCNEN